MTSTISTSHINSSIPEKDTRYLMDSFILDPNEMTLIDTTNNQIVSQDEKLIAALTLLAIRYPDVVTKDELIATIWPHLVVTDWSLTRFIADARKVMGDKHHIKTVHGRGYRYTFPVKKLKNGDRIESIATVTNETAGDFSSTIKKIKFIVASLQIRKIRSIHIVAIACISVLIWLLLQGKEFLSPTKPVIAILPVTLDNGQPSWEWGISAYLAERLGSHVSIVDFYALKQELINWQAHHPNQPLQSTDIQSFCANLGCNSVIAIEQHTHLNNTRLQYTLIGTDHYSVSKEFLDTSLHASLMKLWSDLTHDLKIKSDTVFGIAEPYISETYIESLGSWIEHDESVSLIMLQLLVERYPDFFNGRFLLINLLTHRGEIEKANLLFNQTPATSQSTTELCLMNMIKTELLLQLNEKDLAWKIANQTLPTCKAQNKSLEATALLNRGRVLMALNQQANSDFTAAEAIFEELNSPLALATTYLCQAAQPTSTQGVDHHGLLLKAKTLFDSLQFPHERQCQLHHILMPH